MEADQQPVGQSQMNDSMIHLPHAAQGNYWPPSQPDAQFIQNQVVRFPNAPHQMMTLLTQPQPQPMQFQMYPAASCLYYTNNPAPQQPPQAQCANLQAGHIPPPQKPLCCCQFVRHAHPCFAYYFGSATQPPATNFSGPICQVNPHAHLSQPNYGQAVDHVPNSGPERAQQFDFELLEIGTYQFSFDPHANNPIRPRVRLDLPKKRVIYEFTSSFTGHVKEDELSFKSETHDSDATIEHTDSDDQQQQQDQQEQPQQSQESERMDQSQRSSQSEQQSQPRSNGFSTLQVRNFAFLIPIEAIDCAFIDSNDVYLVISKAPLIFSSDGPSSNINFDCTTLNDPTNGQVKFNRLHRIRFVNNGSEKFFSFLLDIEPRLRKMGTTQKMVGMKDFYYESNGLPDPENA